MQTKNNEIVQKPWGSYQVLEKTEDYWIKKLFVKAGEELSLQSHKHREEVWIIIEGRIIAQKENSRQELVRGGVIKIDKNEKHRILGIEDTLLVEVALGKVDEDDIFRYEDKYGRI